MTLRPMGHIGDRGAAGDPVRGGALWRAMVLGGVLGYLALAVSACAPPPVRRDWIRDQGFEQLLNMPLVRLGQLQDLTAEARLTVRSGNQERRATAVVQVLMPDLLKLEVRGPFLLHVLTAVLVGDTLYVHGPAAGGSWQGHADGFLLESLTGVDLGGYDLRYALLGLVERGSVDSTLAVSYPRGDRAVVPMQGAGGYTRRIWVDLHRGLVTREEITGPVPGWLLTRQLRDYRRVGTVLLPSRVEIMQGVDLVRLDYQRYSVNMGIERSAFRDAVVRDGMRRLD
jgi:hypothetical protein